MFDLVGGDALRAVAGLVDPKRLRSVADKPLVRELGGDEVPRDRSTAVLTELVRLVAAGELDPHVSEVFPFAEAAAAMRAVEGGHALGKVALPGLVSENELARARCFRSRRLSWKRVIELKTPGEIDAIAAAGRVVADVLAVLRAKAAPGVTPRQLDDIASDMIADAGAVSSFRGYHPRWAPGPYPAVTCISVNDAVVHGVPSKRPLKPGDLLSVDFAVHLDGWCADAAFSVVVGDRPDPRDLALIDTTERALAAGIAADGSPA